MIRFRSKQKSTSLRVVADRLWSDCVKLRARGLSEYSGKPGQVAHHLEGKVNYGYRYDLDNGIWLTNGEHFYIAHVQGRGHLINECADRLRGPGLFERLARHKMYSKCDIKMIIIWLQNEKRKLEKDMPLKW
jgi:hypothetical protein